MEPPFGGTITRAKPQVRSTKSQLANKPPAAYACFIVDAFSRRIVGWRVASHMRTEMVLDALEMARRSRGNRRLVGLVAHCDDRLNPAVHDIMSISCN